jgi:hypothetical protein
LELEPINQLVPGIQVPLLNDAEGTTTDVEEGAVSSVAEEGKGAE